MYGHQVIIHLKRRCLKFPSWCFLQYPQNLRRIVREALNTEARLRVVDLRERGVARHPNLRISEADGVPVFLTKPSRECRAWGLLDLVRTVT